MIKIKDFIGKFSFLYGKTKGAVKLPQKTAWLRNSTILKLTSREVCHSE